MPSGRNWQNVFDLDGPDSAHSRRSITLRPSSAATRSACERVSEVVASDVKLNPTATDRHDSAVAYRT
jgi:hypothetical protein